MNRLSSLQHVQHFDAYIYNKKKERKKKSTNFQNMCNISDNFENLTDTT